MKIPVCHEYKKAFKIALMRAFFEYHQQKLKEVINVLKENGWDDDLIESTMFYKPEFFNQRVEQVALPPRQLYYRVRAVMVCFGNQVDSKTKRRLFTPETWKKAQNLLAGEILEGFYSDIPGDELLVYQLNRDGGIRHDKYGIDLLWSLRGTNHVEAIHRQYNTLFRHIAGIELGDAFFRERRHRHNIDVARQRHHGMPEFGHL
jgi:hypothetical protein